MEITKINHVCHFCNSLDFKNFLQAVEFVDTSRPNHIHDMRVHKVYPPSKIKKILKVHTDDTLAQEIMNHLTFFKDDQDMFNDECYEYVFTLSDIDEIKKSLDIEWDASKDNTYWLILDKKNKIYIAFKRSEEDMVHLSVKGQVIIACNQINQFYKENIWAMDRHTFRCDYQSQSYWLNREIATVNDFRDHVFKFKSIKMRLIMYFRSLHEPDMQSARNRMRAFYDKYRNNHPKWQITYSKKRNSSSTSCNKVCFHLYKTKNHAIIDHLCRNQLPKEGKKIRKYVKIMKENKMSNSDQNM